MSRFFMLLGPALGLVMAHACTHTSTFEFAKTIDVKVHAAAPSWVTISGDGQKVPVCRAEAKTTAKIKAVCNDGERPAYGATWEMICIPDECKPGKTVSDEHGGLSCVER